MAPCRIGCCITPHGFGHAARAAAVMEALAGRLEVAFEIVTTVPRWFFAESLSAPFTCHAVTTDIGLIQANAMQEDLPATLQALAGLYPLDDTLVSRVAAIFSGCGLVLCDIAPLGIAAADRAGIPSVLVENFTWDWIYQGYVQDWPDLQVYIDYLQQLYSKSDYHLQAEPVCSPGKSDLKVAPVCRPLRGDAVAIRGQLRVKSGQPLVLVTMGGVSGDVVSRQSMRGMNDVIFVLPGSADTLTLQGNLRLLPHHSGIYHPDLVAAADAVIGKLGYSTVVETYQAATPFGYINRPEFRESKVLADFVGEHMAAKEITGRELHCGDWVTHVAELINLPEKEVLIKNGAEQVAAFVVSILNHKENCCEQA